jgi:hypothetical protein
VLRAVSADRDGLRQLRSLVVQALQHPGAPCLAVAGAAGPVRAVRPGPEGLLAMVRSAGGTVAGGRGGSTGEDPS